MYRQLIVSGFHRSGTSMTMQALVNAGLYAGDSLIGADPSNADGHYEDIETVNLHNAWLRELNSDWCHTSQLPELDTEKANAGIAKIRDRLDKAQQDWGIKDPRACLFLEHWFGALKNPAGVFVYRHYASCLKSLQRRQANELLVNPDTSHQSIRFWSEPDHALSSWLLHNNAILAAAKKYPDQCVVISQEALINNAPVIETVNNALSIALDTHRDLGIDAQKTNSRNELSLLDSTLKDQLNSTWSDLQQVAALPCENTPTVTWINQRNTDDIDQSAMNELTAEWDRLGIARFQTA